ncbi:hypothetical protein DFP73DRAFT_555576 [Morchella snyderi]|nr:hypothetical protein DFP73DRAFT_555576 [Morchella snyderi]
MILSSLRSGRDIWPLAWSYVFSTFLVTFFSSSSRGVFSFLFFTQLILFTLPSPFTHKLVRIQSFISSLLTSSLIEYLNGLIANPLHLLSLCLDPLTLPSKACMRLNARHRANCRPINFMRSAPVHEPVTVALAIRAKGKGGPCRLFLALL